MSPDNRAIPPDYVLMEAFKCRRPDGAQGALPSSVSEADRGSAWHRRGQARRRAVIISAAISRM
jgi:hypothetical protein